MDNLFTAEQMLNIAIREEVTGAEYYRTVAERAQDPEVKQYARKIAAMEDEHAEQFRRLLDQATGHTWHKAGYDGEYPEYLHYLVDGRIFPLGRDAEELARSQPSDFAAVQTAAEMEKNTLLLYQELMQFVPERDRSMLKAIVDEEREHLVMFTKFKERLGRA